MIYDAYQAEAWQVFYAAVAGSSATLIGLLFVALSLNLRMILRGAAHRARAREAFGGLVGLLALALLVLIPGQSSLWLGIELIVGSLIYLVYGVRLQVQTMRRLPTGRRARWMARIALLNLGTLLILWSGLSLLLQRFGGLYWLVLTSLIYFLWSLNNAWLLVAQVAEETESV
jgi:hypothetical protein